LIDFLFYFTKDIMMKKSNEVRIAAREQATELTSEDISEVNGGTLVSTGRCRVISKEEIACEDWQTD
jgi:hypothetical protein